MALRVEGYLLMYESFEINFNVFGCCLNNTDTQLMQRVSKTLSCMCLVSIAVCGSFTTHGSNLAFLKGSTAEKLDEEDIRLLMQAVTEVLADPITPTQRQWRNERTQHHGELRTLSAFTGPNSVRCKRLRVINYTDDRTNKTTYTLCDMIPHGWQLVPSDFASRPQPKP